MRLTREETSSSAPQVIDLVSSVKALHGLSYQELNKLIKNSENFTLCYSSENGILEIEMEKLVSFLSLHLIAVLMSSDRDETLYKYLLSGLRLMHSLCELAPRHAKLEQVLLDNVKISEQHIDMVFYLLIVSAGGKQDHRNFGDMPILHSALVACSLHLLTGCISSQWQDLALVLLAHPKVDIFMDAAFGAVCAAVKSLHLKLLGYTAEETVNYLCQQCEASLQFLHSLCQQKLFRERLLRNKELCGKGGVLFVVKAVLNLTITPHFKESPRVVAGVSRMKAKVLSILVTLCEVDSISYLDEVASSPGSLDLAKSVAIQVLELLRTTLGRDPRPLNTSSNKSYPMGFLQLNAMRLADIFSDDSNFRSFITIHSAKLLAAMFSLAHGDFLSCWCSSELPIKEEDVTIEYDLSTSAGWLVDIPSLPNPKSLEFIIVTNSMTQASYAHLRTSLLVKVIANLHCFVPTICEEEDKHLFLNKFMECLQMDQSNALPGFSFASDAPKAVTVCRNLRSLLSHAESLIPNALNEEDVQLLRMFLNQVQSRFTSADFEENPDQETQSAGGLLRKEAPNHRSGDDAMQGNEGKPSRSEFGGVMDMDKDAQNVETSGSDSSSTRGKHVADKTDNPESQKSNASIKESGYRKHTEEKQNETVQYEEKQRRKRKRTIMNDEQIAQIENALKVQPDMQRNVGLIMAWADKITCPGSEVTAAQLKNWLNNRKARLARSGNNFRVASEVDNSLPDKRGALRSNDTPKSPAEDVATPSNVGRDPQISGRSSMAEISLAAPSEAVAAGQNVVLVDAAGEETGKGRVFQARGQWYGNNLEELRTFVVDVKELRVSRGTGLPYASIATGVSFEEAETQIGVMRVMWDRSRVFVMPSK
ncbi:hypothetical protein UlMin_031339 [Ulmus minor]